MMTAHFWMKSKIKIGSRFVKFLGKCIKLTFIALSAAVIHNSAFNWVPGETMPQGN